MRDRRGYGGAGVPGPRRGRLPSARSPAIPHRIVEANRSIGAACISRPPAACALRSGEDSRRPVEQAPLKSALSERKGLRLASE